MPEVSIEEGCRSVAQYRRLSNWRTKAGKWPGSKDLGFDDSGWEACDLGFSWDRKAGERWLRREIVIPETVHGISVKGSRVDIRIWSAGIELYVDGKLVDRGDYWFDCMHPLTRRAMPGETHIVAIRSPPADSSCSLGFAEYYIESVEDVLLALGMVDSRARLITDLVGLGRLGEKQAAAQLAIKGLQLAPQDCEDLGKARDKAKQYNSQLMQLSGGLSDLTSFLVGHAHIDMNWLWSWDDTVETCRRTFTSANRLMDEFPQLVFSQSQAAVYSAMEELEPQVFQMIRRRVKDGRWEITASTWVEGDLNMASGESLVRQTTCALNYIESRFGVTPNVCWCPDTFGHPWTYPQILSKCGLRYYYAHRCPRRENEHLLWWEAPDGSRVLVFNEGASYSNTIRPELTRYFAKMLRNFDLPARMVVFGVGDHGGGPTWRDLHAAAVMNRERQFPRFRNSRAEDFFKTVESSPRIPVVRDELNFVFEGCYTTHGDIKWMNRRAENMLYETEVLATLASSAGMAYPTEDLEKAWRNALFNQFHDLLDGSAIKVSYEHSRKLFDEATEACKRIAATSEPVLLNIVSKRDPRRVSIFNPFGWERTDPVRVPLPEGATTGLAVVEAGSGREVPSQILDQHIIFAASIPPVGHQGYEVISTKRQEITREDSDAPRLIPPDRPGRPHVLENRFFRIGVDFEYGTIKSLFDKRLNRELASPWEPMNLFQICYEKPHGMSAWYIGPTARTDNLLDGAQVRLADVGPVQAVIHVERKFLGSSLKQDIVIHRDIPRIDFVTEVDWQEVGGPKVDSPMLKVAFPFAHSSATCIREIPFGHIASPTNGREVPSLSFLELPGEGFGVALLNDCKYGHDVRGNAVRLTLVRAAYDPDPLPDQGVHRITYSIFPHPGDWKEAEVWKRGHELNLPLRVTPGGACPVSRSWLTIDAPGVDLSALKLSDDGNAIVLRLVEMHGRKASFTVSLGWKAKGFRKCDLRERPTGRVEAVKAMGMSLELGPYEIGTWRIE